MASQQQNAKRTQSNRPLILYFVLSLGVTWALIGIVIAKLHGVIQTSLPPLSLMLMIGA